MDFLIDIFKSLGLSSFVFIYFILNSIFLYFLNKKFPFSFEEEIFYLKEEPAKLTEENSSLKTNLFYLKNLQEKEVREFERALLEKESKIRNIFEKSYRKEIKRLEIIHEDLFEDKKKNLESYPELSTDFLEKKLLEKIT